MINIVCIVYIRIDMSFHENVMKLLISISAVIEHVKVSAKTFQSSGVCKIRVGASVYTVQWQNHFVTVSSVNSYCILHDMPLCFRCMDSSFFFPLYFCVLVSLMSLSQVEWRVFKSYHHHYPITNIRHMLVVFFFFDFFPLASLLLPLCPLCRGTGTEAVVVAAAIATAVITIGVASLLIAYAAINARTLSRWLFRSECCIFFPFNVFMSVFFFSFFMCMLYVCVCVFFYSDTRLACHCTRQCGTNSEETG